MIFIFKMYFLSWENYLFINDDYCFSEEKYIEFKNYQKK